MREKRRALLADVMSQSERGNLGISFCPPNRVGVLGAWPDKHPYFTALHLLKSDPSTHHGCVFSTLSPIPSLSPSLMDWERCDPSFC
ncbi:hypothetical protein PGIGA_G00073800 [Pangasianodon gigas]|uniref:Uncharacterized protein n=1 Tax=Pangasianodon gigas TaxID=30993 RepID=A0ACC5X867_PANGG|nr:hypothetical protein [Pangasianodon gigas]